MSSGKGRDGMEVEVEADDQKDEAQRWEGAGDTSNLRPVDGLSCKAENLIHRSTNQNITTHLHLPERLSKSHDHNLGKTLHRIVVYKTSLPGPFLDPNLFSPKMEGQHLAILLAVYTCKGFW